MTDPPLVTRPDPEVPVAPPRPRPGFLEAVLWCAAFVAVQATGAVVTVGGVFAAYAIAAADTGKFVDEQLGGFSKALDPNAEGGRVAVPFEFGQALAWGMLAAQVAALGLIALVLPRRIGPDWKRQIGFRPARGLHVFLVLLIAPAFMIVAEFVQQLFLQATGLQPPAMREVLAVFARFPWPLTLLAVAVGPGVVEELWFRGFLGRGLSARYGFLLGVPLVSLLFAAAHMSLAGALVYTLMGAYLYGVYVATRSIWPAVLLHALNNGAGVVLALVVPPESLDRPLPLVVPLAALALLIFGSVALWTSRAEVELTPGGGCVPWQAESPGVSEPPPDASARLVYAPVSPAALLFTLVSLAALVFLALRFAG